MVLKKSNMLRELFGSLNYWKIDTQKFKDELRVEEAYDFRKLNRQIKKRTNIVLIEL